MYDMVLHVGDFAYDLDTVKSRIFFFIYMGSIDTFSQENARVGDEFMRQVEALAAYIPYMTTVGNHEQK